MDNNVYIGITAITGGIILSSIVLVAIFASQSMFVVPWIACSVAALGIALGYFASQGKKE